MQKCKYASLEQALSLSFQVGSVYYMLYQYKSANSDLYEYKSTNTAS